jgi:hypothetical protein
MILNGYSQMNYLIKNATIFYKNGFRKICDVISINEKGVYSGFMKTSDDKDEFVNNSFTPINQIRKIIVINNGKFKKINF